MLLGVCVAHGAPVKRCKFEGCDKQVQKQGNINIYIYRHTIKNFEI